MISAHVEIEETAIEKIGERLEALRAFAEQNRAVLQEQRHLDKGTPERAYWHAGYASALTDVLNMLLGTRKSSAA